MKNLEKEFKQIGKKLVFQFKRELEQQGHRASKSGSIIDGLRFTTSDTELRITTDKAYAAVLNNGSKPHFPNRDAIEDWVRKKGFASDEKEVKKIALKRD